MNEIAMFYGYFMMVFTSMVGTLICTGIMSEWICKRFKAQQMFTQWALEFFREQRREAQTDEKSSTVGKTSQPPIQGQCGGGYREIGKGRGE